MVASTNWGRGRFTQTSLFLNPTDKSVIQNDLQIQIAAEGHNAAFTARIFHNKFIGYGQRLIRQFSDYFTPYFLFLGDGMPQRYRIYNVGLLYICFIIPLVLLVINPKVKIQRPLLYYFSYLLLISVIPAAISVDDFPNIHRSVFMVIPLIFFIALSLENMRLIFQHKTGRIAVLLTLIFGSALVLEIVYVSHQYFILSGKINSFLPDRREFADGRMAKDTW